MNKLFILLCLLFNFQNSLGQSKRLADSLENRLSMSFTNDTIQINTIVNLVRELYASDANKATQYAQKGILLSEKLNFKKGKVRLLHYLGLITYYKGENERAINYFLESLKMSETIKDNEMTGVNMSRIGDINREEGNYKKAEQLINQALEILKKTNNKTFLISSFFHKGLLHLYQKQFQEAIENFNEGLFYAKVIKDNRLIAIGFYYLAEVYLKQNNYTQSLNYYYQSLNVNLKINNLLLLASTFNNIARVKISINEIDSAIIYSHKGLIVAQKTFHRQQIEGAYGVLYQSYQQKGKIDSAFIYQSKWISIKDSLFNEEKSKQINLLQYNAQIEKNKIEIEKQKAEIAMKNILLYAFVGVIVFILVVLFILYRNNIAKYKANVKLQTQKEEITEQKHQIETQNANLQMLNEEIIQQKEEIKTFNNHLEDLVENRTNELEIAVDNLLKQNQDLQQFSYIISHNLRSPVARILGLVNILDKQAIQNTPNESIINHIVSTVDNLDTVIKDLTQILAIRNNLDKTKEMISLEEVINIVKNHLEDDIKRTNATFDVNFLEVPEILSIKSYVQSILYNLISNAIKYHSYERSPYISIKTNFVSKYVCLSVQDNGIGMDLKNMDIYKIFGLYQRMNTIVEGKGLGLYLVKTQIESLGGKIEVESKLGEGSTFNVYFLK